MGRTGGGTKTRGKSNHEGVIYGNFGPGRGARGKKRFQKSWGEGKKSPPSLWIERRERDE